MADPLVVTLGCRLNAFESEVMRREADAAGLRRGDRQHLRGDRRGGAPGAADDPQAAPPASRTGASSSPAAPRSSAPQSFADMPEVDRVLGNAEKLDRAQLAGDGEPVVVSDIMSGAADGGASAGRLRGTGARLRRGAAGLRPPLHLLHHPVRARTEPQRAGSRW